MERYCLSPWVHMGLKYSVLSVLWRVSLFSKPISPGCFVFCHMAPVSLQKDQWHPWESIIWWSVHQWKTAGKVQVLRISETTNWAPVTMKVGVWTDNLTSQRMLTGAVPSTKHVWNQSQYCARWKMSTRSEGSLTGCAAVGLAPRFLI